MYIYIYAQPSRLVSTITLATADDAGSDGGGQHLPEIRI